MKRKASLRFYGLWVLMVVAIGLLISGYLVASWTLVVTAIVLFVVADLLLRNLP